MSPADLMAGWLERQLPPPAFGWLHARRQEVLAGASERSFNLAISLAPRRLGKADLALGPAELAEAARVRPGWDPRGWSVDQAGRLVLLLARPGPPEALAAALQSLLALADLGETITFLRGLPLYPGPQSFLPVAREGLRSAVRPVFEAVAHANPFPAEMLDEPGWNHLVLKALFIETTLAPIQRLDGRANPALMRMLCDYAHERWAAGRPVSPELWRCVGPWADDAARQDLERVLRTGSADEQEAARAALNAVPAMAN